MFCLNKKEINNQILFHSKLQNHVRDTITLKCSHVLIFKKNIPIKNWDNLISNYKFFSILSKYQITVAIMHIGCGKPYDISLSETYLLVPKSQKKKDPSWLDCSWKCNQVKQSFLLFAEKKEKKTHLVFSQIKNWPENFLTCFWCCCCLTNQFNSFMWCFQTFKTHQLF